MVISPQSAATSTASATARKSKRLQRARAYRTTRPLSTMKLIIHTMECSLMLSIKMARVPQFHCYFNATNLKFCSIEPILKLRGVKARKTIFWVLFLTDFGFKYLKYQ